MDIKVNIIMPTYNDSKTIVESLDSIKNQTYENWQLTIVNDGSTDDTESVVKKYIKDNNLEDKIRYIYEENKDQLNAIINSLDYIDDDGIIYVLHSDDTFENEESLYKAVFYMCDNTLDALMSDLTVMDENSSVTGLMKVRDYDKSERTLALQTLWLGRNLFFDVAFWRASVYKNYVRKSYLTWNIPAWINTDFKGLLNIRTIHEPLMRYRVFSENYINNEVGNLNVLSGEVRTELLLLKHYSIPFFKIQYCLFRALNKLNINYRPLFIRLESHNIYNILKFIIGKRISDVKKYPYFESILNFFKNRVSRSITIKEVNSSDVFFGSDTRSFNKKLINNELPKVYYSLFKEMNKGFDKVVTNQESFDNLVNILKYIGIYEYVSVVIK